MAGWREQVNNVRRQQVVDRALEEPNAVDEFAAADCLDNESPADQPGWNLMSDALEDLRAKHLAFRRADKCEDCDLEELRLAVLTAVTASPDLQDYYAEAWGIERGAEAAPGGPPAPPSLYRRVAVMQVELMVRAFTTLQLRRFGNAPENHGWMVLFRRWGWSSRFNVVFEELRPTLPPEFVKFYDLYLYHLPPFASVRGTLPMHHPWLLPANREARARFRGRGVYMDSGIVEGEIDVEVRPGTGGVVDARGPERADQTFERPSDTGSTGGGTEPASND